MTRRRDPRHRAAGCWPRSRPRPTRPASGPTCGLRDQLDIDSMDFLNFVIALHEELHVDIPEADYPRLQTLDDFVDYLTARAER